MGNTSSSTEKPEERSRSSKTKPHSRSPTAEAKVKPRHLLWGCSTSEEHYEAVRIACGLAVDHRGLEGLQRLGFEFRKVHTDPCTCQEERDVDVESLSDDEDEAKNDRVDDVIGVEIADNEDGDDTEAGVKCQEGISTNACCPTSSFAKNRTSNGDYDGDGDGDGDGDSKPTLEEAEAEEGGSQMFFVPLGTRISDLELKSPLSLEFEANECIDGINGNGNGDGDGDNNENDDPYTTPAGFLRTQSAASLFSLATHHSMSSNESSVFSQRRTSTASTNRSSINSISSLNSSTDTNTNNNNNINNNSKGKSNNQHNRHTIVNIHGKLHDVDHHQTCSQRLFHVASDTMITEKVHQNFIAHGKMYDEVARLCMEYAQDSMMDYGNLEWVAVCEERDIRALASRKPTKWENNEKATRQTLLVVTGKGRVGAGIFSRRLCMTMGLEPSTALPFVEEAVRRDMSVIVLDPNSKEGEKMNAMEVVEASLERLCFNDNADNRPDEIYVLAHSMAGSQLVRFMLNKANNHPSLSEEGGDPTDAANDSTTSSSLESCLRRIKAIAFTDSNHNINWVKKYPSLLDFFTGPNSIYIKSHKVHEDAKALGEEHHDCQYWRHRFGAIKTLWAGTNEHALTNHTARFHIWDHFDSFR